MKPRIVLSGVNLVDAGPLAVFTDALRELAHSFSDRYTITALVHQKSLFHLQGIEYLEFPRIKSSYARRLWFEYVTCRTLSRELNAHLWLAMHDITPNVTATIRAVYCHNPAPFYRLSWREALLDCSFTFFCFFYKFLYGIGIGKNDWVIVQQDWLRQEFRKRYGVRNVLVAHPSIPPFPATNETLSPTQAFAFFYPAMPRPFKNMETLLSASSILPQDPTLPPFEVWLTIDGTENAYAAGLKERFHHLPFIRWMGKLSRTHVASLYTRAGCLVFPSKLETWGMPISEWKMTGKPMLLADLPYARETVGTYESVEFFPIADAQRLAEDMRDVLTNNFHPKAVQAAPIAAPFASDWRELFQQLLSM